ncbi:hypothetical protein ABIA33_002985 [Streptacidiphilus sp. MAP12-16]
MSHALSSHALSADATVTRPDGGTLTVTATPAQHGPEGCEPISGEIVGFVLTATDLPTLYVSGDNASLALVEEITERFGPVDTAVLLCAADCSDSGALPPAALWRSVRSARVPIRSDMSRLTPRRSSRRWSVRRSDSEVPPHTPVRCPVLSAHSKHGRATGQPPHTALALANSRAPGPRSTSGKKISGSSPRQAACDQTSSHTSI